jgi:hypothetical protein
MGRFLLIPSLINSSPGSRSCRRSSTQASYQAGV